MNKINNNNLEVAHPLSGSSSTRFMVELEFGNVGFWGEAKTDEKILGALIEGEQQQTQQKSINRSRTGFQLRPHCWEASALITSPPLLYVSNFHCLFLQPLSPSFIVAFCYSKFHFNNCPLWFTDKFCKVKILIIA